LSGHCGDQDNAAAKTAKGASVATAISPAMQANATKGGCVLIITMHENMMRFSSLRNDSFQWFADSG
jgi:hypothetical protein